MATIVKVNLGDDIELDAGKQTSAKSIPVCMATDEIIRIAEGDTNWTGQIPISGSGIFVQGPDIENQFGFVVTVDLNRQTVYICPHDQSGSGYPFDYYHEIYLPLKNLNQVDFYSTTSSLVCWRKP